MTTENAFLAAICADPESDGPRLQYADWLEEQGRSDHAEFIRVQVELEPLRTHGHGINLPMGGDCPMCLHVARLERRERKLLGTVSRRLMRALPGQWTLDPNDSDYPDYPKVRFSRGFVEEIHCRCTDWLRHGPALVSRLPIRRVALSDKRPWYNSLLAAGDAPWAWWPIPRPDRDPGPEDRHEIPFAVWQLLREGSFWDTILELPCYHTEADAVDALSNVALAWARQTEATDVR